MDILTEFTLLVEERKKYQGDIDYDNNPTIGAMINLLTKNINETIAFIDNQCSGEHLIWMSEIFDEIAEISKSHSLIDALYRAAERFPEESRQYNIRFFIDSAAEYGE
ncbi:MAG: hypothetical protein HUJ72_10545 [Blautia sp.]|nr:hypothetical protein [Blautia sp.]